MALIFNLWSYGNEILEGWVDILEYDRPLSSTQHFHDRIQEADRIVVRDGGYNCCGSVKNDPILFTVTDPEEIGAVFDHIRFVVFTNELAGGCMCCGYPGIDWYKGRKRLALTSLQHGHNIRWKQFGTSYFGPFRSYGDIPLTLDSSVWMLSWLQGHGVTNGQEFTTEYIDRLKIIANHGLESTGAPPAADTPETHP